MDPCKNPFAGLLAKLSGVEPPKKKARQGWQQYMHECRATLQPLIDIAWEQKKAAGPLKSTDRNDATFRAEVVRQEYNKLSASDKKKYQANAQADKIKDAARYKAELAAATAKTPENRLRFVES